MNKAAECVMPVEKKVELSRYLHRKVNFPNKSKLSESAFFKINNFFVEQKVTGIWRK